MSERRPANEMTDPGPPPEEALDATLRALGAPVAAQTRRTPDSAGLDAAHYHAEAHRPPRAHEPPSGPHVATTEPMGAAHTPVAQGTVRVPLREPRPDMPTVPRAAPPPSRTTTFVGALAFVVVVLGIGMWALTRGPAAASPDVASATTPPRSVAIVPVSVPLPLSASASASASAAVFAPAAVSGASLVSSGVRSPATVEGPQPTARPQPASSPIATAAPPRTATAVAPSSPSHSSSPPAVSPPAASPPAASPPTATPAPTSKYNHLLKEDKQ